MAKDKKSAKKSSAASFSEALRADPGTEVALVLDDADVDVDDPAPDAVSEGEHATRPSTAAAPIVAIRRRAVARTGFRLMWSL